MTDNISEVKIKNLEEKIKMNQTLDRIFRTSSSERYRLYVDNEAYADLSIHYGSENVKVDIILLTIDDKEIDEHIIENLDDILTSQVILSHSSHIKEIQYSIYTGRKIAVSNNRPNEVCDTTHIEYL